jgi:hypothetical protein
LDRFLELEPRTVILTRSANEAEESFREIVHFVQDDGMEVQDEVVALQHDGGSG